ncbi:hypothetical protein CVS40_7809 [Lucilia cuprina]|nr:hypothetical protein CVS40_7809 [Lucilia cuprina]
MKFHFQRSKILYILTKCIQDYQWIPARWLQFSLILYSFYKADDVKLISSRMTVCGENVILTQWPCVFIGRCELVPEKR